MKLTTAIRNQNLRELWLGQLGSSVGDEIYRVAFTWLAVQIVGENTGYLTSLQLIVVFLFSVFGGRLLDHVSPFSAMIRVDLARACIVMIPVVMHLIGFQSFPLLVLTSLLIAGLGVFFDPALHGLLPSLAQDHSALRGATGLMSTTTRLARVFGPMVVGVFSSLIAPIHFFTLDSITFLLSALSISRIRKRTGNRVMFAPELSVETFLQSLKSTYHRVRAVPSVYRTLMAKAFTGGAWNTAFTLGIVLLVKDEYPGNVKLFGLVMSAYGVGNVLAAFVIGNMERKRSEYLIFLGLLWLGVSFLFLSFSHSLLEMMIWAAIAAIGGPLNDTPFNDLVQSHFKGRELVKVYRLRTAVDVAFQLAFMLLAPMLFRVSSPRIVIAGCALTMLVVGAYGVTLKVQRRPF